MLFSLVVLLVVLCSIIIESHAVFLQSYHNNKWIGTLRGGARHSKKSSSIGRVSSSKSRRHREEEEDDDDEAEDVHEEEEEEDYESDRINIRGKRHGKSKGKLPTRKSKSSGSGKGSKFQLVPWGSRNQSNQKKKKGPSLKERLEQLAKQGHTAYNEVYRRAKVLRSSAFEGILLKATWPGNDPVPPELLTEIVKYSIPAFKYSRSDAEDDPYYLTMHKLWTKMSEKDWRTVSKSLYILHCISRDSSTEACSRFATAIKDLSKTKNPKKSDYKYFDLRQISELDGPSSAYQAFVKSYAAYVLFRSKFFCARFEELRGLSASTSEKKALAVLLKAQQLIKLGLQAVAPKKPQRNIITGQAIKLILVDLKELWKLYSEKAAILLNSEGSGYQEPKAGDKDVSSVLKFLQEGEGQLKEHLSTTAKAFASLKLKLPADLETSTVPADALSAKLNQLLNISGGAIKSKKNQIKDDDDDDDDEEEEDEEEEDDEEDEVSEEEQEEEEEDDEGDVEEEEDDDDDQEDAKSSGDDDDDENEDDDEEDVDNDDDDEQDEEEEEDNDEDDEDDE